MRRSWENRATPSGSEDVVHASVGGKVERLQPRLCAVERGRGDHPEAVLSVDRHSEGEHDIRLPLFVGVWDRHAIDQFEQERVAEAVGAGERVRVEEDPPVGRAGDVPRREVELHQRLERGLGCGVQVRIGAASPVDHTNRAEDEEETQTKRRREPFQTLHALTLALPAYRIQSMHDISPSTLSILRRFHDRWRRLGYSPPVTSIAVLVFDGVEELDFVGPWEVLAAWASQHPDDAVEVYTVGWTGREIECAKRLHVTADRSREELGTPDVLLVPGGRGTRPLVKDEAFLEMLRQTAGRGARIASVCTGSLTLAAAGLLDGKPATTHWSAVETLAGLGRNIEVRPDERFVSIGSIVTAAGVSAGIDMALHLVAELSSVERAREVRRYIQYDPAPPV